jgi:hypothetical protein
MSFRLESERFDDRRPFRDIALDRVGEILRRTAQRLVSLSEQALS